MICLLLVVCLGMWNGHSFGVKAGLWWVVFDARAERLAWFGPRHVGTNMNTPMRKYRYKSQGVAPRRLGSVRDPWPKEGVPALHTLGGADEAGLQGSPRPPGGRHRQDVGRLQGILQIRVLPLLALPTHPPSTTTMCLQVHIIVVAAH